MTPANPRTRSGLRRIAWYGSVALVCLAVSVVFFIGLTRVRGADAIYPFVVILVFTVLALAALVLEVRSAGRLEAAVADDPDGGLEGLRGAGIAWGRVGASAAAVVGSVVVLSSIGYAAFVAVLSAVLVRILGMRSPVRILLFAVGTAIAMYLVFVFALHSPIPRGSLTRW